jgi:hypothetical protein
MRSCKLFLILSILGIGALVVSAPATADIINGSTTVFADDFENVPAAGAWPTDGSYLPSPEVGWAWTVADSKGGRQFQVTNTTPPGPGAPTGTQFLRIACESDGAVAGYMNFPNQSAGHIHMENYFLFAQSGSGNCGQMLGLDVYGSTVFNIVAYNGTIQTYGYDGFTDSGVAVSSGWQKLTIDWDIGSPDYTLTVGDTVLNNRHCWEASGGLRQVELTSGGGNGLMYYDAVPEPCTTVLLTTGLVGLLAYAWRKRK